MLLDLLKWLFFIILIKNHLQPFSGFNVLDSDKGYSQKWVCDFCQQPYETEQEAKNCYDSHEDIKLEPEFVLGDPLPTRIKVSRIHGNKVLAQGIYVKIGQIIDGVKS